MRRTRIEKVEAAINRFPYRHHAIDDAYARFLTDGTLPEDWKLAGAVLQRVLDARKPVPELLAERRALGLHQPYGTTREMLFREAVCTIKPVRDAARLLLRCLVKVGCDPTDPEIIGPELEPIDFAPISMQLLAWPPDDVSPQHEAQMQRVMRQQAEVRSHRPAGNADWDRGAGAALSAFLQRGEVPSDSRYFLYVLTTCEMLALYAHALGKVSDELPAAFEAAATTSGPEREAALLHLGVVQVRSQVAE